MIEGSRCHDRSSRSTSSFRGFAENFWSERPGALDSASGRWTCSFSRWEGTESPTAMAEGRSGRTEGSSRPIYRAQKSGMGKAESLVMGRRIWTLPDEIPGLWMEILIGSVANAEELKKRHRHGECGAMTGSAKFPPLRHVGSMLPP